MALLSDPELAEGFALKVARRGHSLSSFADEAGLDRNTVRRFQQNRGVSGPSLRAIRETYHRLPEIVSAPVEAAS